MAYMDVGMLAFIPSPGSGIFQLGPVPIHAYGLCIAAGIISGIWLSERRWAQRGHDPKQVTSIACWAVLAGIIGARAYHVATDYELYSHNIVGAFKIWDGGLAIWGAVAAGTIAVAIVGRIKKLDVIGLMDSMACGVVLAQAFGRWGNYFNQEIFGRPTTLPWGLEIDIAHRPEQYQHFATFQPTFLYESLWCLAVLAILLFIERRWVLRKGQVAAAYIALYTGARFGFENMRSDYAHVIAGMRVNAWASLGLFTFGVGWFIIAGKRGKVYDPAVAVGQRRAAGGVGDSATGGDVAGDSTADGT